MNPTTPTPRVLRVLIIGGGTGGGCLAHGLKRAGIEVQVFERQRSQLSNTGGYRVGISPDGSRALAECLPEDLYRTFVATCARPPRHFNLLTEGLREVGSFDIHELGLDQDALHGEQNVSRTTLRQVLFTGLEDCLHFDKTFTHYEQHADGTVTAFFADGSSATGDVLVAADGTNSRVRQQYLPHARLEDTGILSTGGKLPMTPETRALLPPKVQDGLSIVAAPRGYGLIIHVMRFQFDRQRVKPGIGESDAERLARWPGLLYDNTSDYIGWGFWAARQHFPADPMTLQGTALVDLTLRMTDGWHPALRRLIELSDPTTVFPINVRTSVPLQPWAPTPVTLLGDAIHTMTPGRGIGANTALRDAALLCRRLTAVRGGQLSLLQAIGDYEAHMRQYGFEAVLRSRQQMNAQDPINTPLLGTLMLGAMRTGMRLVNAVPPLKRRMAAAMFRDRQANQDGPPLTAPAAPPSRR